MFDSKLVIGVDFGTDSCRALVVDALTGEQIAEAVSEYPRWSRGLYCDPAADQYRQHPKDYIDSFKSVVRMVVGKIGHERTSQIIGISFDTTGSTPVIVNSDGIPLSLTEQFEEDPDAMFILWKDHTAKKEADDINSLAHSSDIDYTSFSGGSYSAEWAWAKVLHVLRSNRKVAQAAYSWMEHCEWISAWATGITKPETAMRSRCAAGHKAMWNAEWGGYPSKDFLSKLNPALGVMRERMNNETSTGDTCAGIIRAELADELGLPRNVKVGIGVLDAHEGAVGASIAPNVMVKIVGTSTCDMLICDKETVGNRKVKGICGQVDGSVVPGYIGFEAGQAAFGDIYAWFRRLLLWPVENHIPEKEREIKDWLLPAIEKDAMNISPSESAPIALDWFNGRRTPDANLKLKGSIIGLTLGTTAPMIYKALVEATAFGSRAIMERYISEGINIESVTAVGGISQKSRFVMQILADVMGVEITVNECKQTCALGAAMFATVAAGVYPDVLSAQKILGVKSFKKYSPIRENSRIYDQLYEKYIRVGNYFTNL